MTSEVSEKRLFKIGDVCKLADVQPYVLRYWETEFPPLAPTKSGGGQRLYTQREVDIVLRIKELLYSEGFTIAGAKKRLEGEMVEGVVQPPAAAVPGAALEKDAAASDDTEALRAKVVSLRKDLEVIRDLLK